MPCFYAPVVWISLCREMREERGGDKLGFTGFTERSKKMKAPSCVTNLLLTFSCSCFLNMKGFCFPYIKINQISVG